MKKAVQLYAKERPLQEQEQIMRFFAILEKMVGPVQAHSTLGKLSWVESDAEYCFVIYVDKCPKPEKTIVIAWICRIKILTDLITKK